MENIIIRNGEHSYVNGNGNDYDHSLGGRYASFELDGVRYVITDEETLDKALDLRKIASGAKATA